MKDGSPYLIGGTEYIRQKLSVRFKFFFGEWFLNQNEGIPYFRDVFVHDPKLDVIASLFKRVITNCPGVLALKSYAMNYDPLARSLTFSFQATVDGGEVVVTAKDRDFVVDANRLTA